MILKAPDSYKSFLSGGGEMGKLIRSKDWSQTSMGDPNTWLQSLRTALSIILNSRFPMFLWWGKDLICFYNDAYRPSLGINGKHPSILGQPAIEAWPEIWDIIKPLIDHVLSTGEATWDEDRLIPIYRNGKLEDVYWTFSYSPVIDESGRAAGVMVICNETTEKVKAFEDLKQREEQINFTLDAANLATWDLDPTTNRFLGNNRLKEWFGLRPESEIELPLAISSIIEKDRQKVLSAINKALEPGSDGHYEIEYTIVNPINHIERRVLAKGRAVFNEMGIAHRFSGTLEDITQQVLAQHKAEESERRFRKTVQQAPIGITIFRGPLFVVEMANETYLEIVGRMEADFIGKPLFTAMPEVESSVGPLLHRVFKTGIPYYGSEFPVNLNRYGKKELTYFNFVYQPLKEENEQISGIMVVATEVTSSVKAKQSVAESEKQFRNLVMQSPIPMAIFRGEDHIIEMANTMMFEKIWRKKEADVIGRPMLEVFPELNDQKYPALLRRVFTSGIPYHENEALAIVDGDDGRMEFYLDFEYAPLSEPDGTVAGIIVTVNDVTEKVESRKKAEDAETRMRLAVEATELATWDLNLQTREIIHSPRLAEIFGYTKDTRLSHAQMRSQIHAGDIYAVVEKSFDLALVTGIYYYEARVVKPGNIISWIRTQGKVFYNEDNQPVKIIGTLRDITEEKYYQEELQESEQKFRLLADSMPQHVWTADITGYLNYFNKAVYSYSGLTPELMIKDGWLQIVHPDDREENVKAWMLAVSEGKDFLFEHRFRRHDGEYRWQLSRAIPQRDASGNIQMWVGTSTDIQDQKTFSNELERQVNERTRELEQKNTDLVKMNAELETFAYVASHDLQEPLRKIQSFASLIDENENQNLSEKGKDYFRRMQAAAARMNRLIEDLLTYSRTATGERNFSDTDLNEILEEVKNDLKESLAEKNAVIEANHLCSANIIPFQFRQLLNNLLGNSLKFSKKGEAPHITIISEIVAGNNADIVLPEPAKNYCHISVADNGIGFEPRYKERIFELFQRLYGKSEYSGTGIGLAIVKKIVENHKGVITASGELTKGARFDIYIPVHQY